MDGEEGKYQPTKCTKPPITCKIRTFQTSMQWYTST